VAPHLLSYSETMKRKSSSRRGSAKALITEKREEFKQGLKELEDIQKKDEQLRQGIKKTVRINTGMIAQRCFDPSVNWKELSQDELYVNI
jgi:phage host-nuclease inhibitor protein Gam